MWVGFKSSCLALQNRTICLLTWSDTDHHQTLYRLQTCLRESEKCGNTNTKKEQKRKKQTKKICKQKYDNCLSNEIWAQWEVLVIMVGPMRS